MQQEVESSPPQQGGTNMKLRLPLSYLAMLCIKSKIIFPCRPIYNWLNNKSIYTHCTKLTAAWKIGIYNIPCTMYPTLDAVTVNQKYLQNTFGNFQFRPALSYCPVIYCKFFLKQYPMIDLRNRLADGSLWQDITRAQKICIIAITPGLIFFIKIIKKCWHSTITLKIWIMIWLDTIKSIIYNDVLFEPLKKEESRKKETNPFDLATYGGEVNRVNFTKIATFKLLKMMHMRTWRSW